MNIVKVDINNLKIPNCLFKTKLNRINKYTPVFTNVPNIISTQDNSSSLKMV